MATQKYVDYKFTKWGRIYFTDDTDLKEKVKLLERGHLPSELCDEKGFLSYEDLDDTEEYMSPSENDSQQTIEVYSNGKLIWDNAGEI